MGFEFVLDSIRKKWVASRDANHLIHKIIRICFVCLVGATDQGGTPMSLKKLWNSLRGSRSEPESPVIASVSTPTPSTAPAAQPASAPAPQPARNVEPLSAPIAEVVPPRRSILSLRPRGEHDALLKLISQARPTSILEVGIGDGSRMPAVLASLADAGTESKSFKAIVIDEFEMAGGEVTMRDYHRQLAGLAIRPVIFPESVARGLVNVAHRFGAVDMILIDASVETAHAEGLSKFLSKVTHVGTAVLSNTSGKWAVRQSGTDAVRRAA